MSETQVKSGMNFFNNNWQQALKDKPKYLLAYQPKEVLMLSIFWVNCSI